MELFQAHPLRDVRAEKIARSAVRSDIKDRSVLLISALILLAAVALRSAAVLLIPPVYDEMVQLYMAKDIAEGTRFPLYFYGQQYMGPLESYVLAPFFRWFGFSVTLGRTVYEAFFLCFALLLLAVIKRLFNVKIALIAGMLLAVLPFPVLYYTAVVGFSEMFALSLLSLWLLLRMADHPRKTLPALFLGVVCGLGFWCYPLFVIWFPAIGGALYLSGMPPQTRERCLLACFAGFLLGLIPVVWHGVQTGVFLMLDAGGEKNAPWTALPHMAYLFFARLKYFLSSNVYEAPRAGIMRGISCMPLLIFCAAFAAYAAHSARTWRLETAGRKMLHLFMLVPALLTALLYCSRDLAFSEANRYFLPLTATYCFTVAWWTGRLRKPALRFGLMGLLMACLLTANVFAFETERKTMAAYREILGFLRTRNCVAGAADFSLAYTLRGLHPDLRVLPIGNDWRYLPISSGVDSGHVQFVVLPAGDERGRLLQRCPNVLKTGVGNHDVYVGPSRDLETLLAAPLQHERWLRSRQRRT